MLSKSIQVFIVIILASIFILFAMYVIDIAEVEILKIKQKHIDLTNKIINASTHEIKQNKLTIDTLRNEINTIKSDLFEAEKECIENRNNLGR
jgi:hypothetical protein